MRWLLRLLLFWAISAPLFYLFGLPMLLDMLSKKAQAQGYAQCATHIKAIGLVGSSYATLTEYQGEKYCHCVSDGLIFTQHDVIDMVQKKQPAALNALAQSLSTQCNAALEGSAAPAAPAPTADPDLIHL